MLDFTEAPLFASGSQTTSELVAFALQADWRVFATGQLTDQNAVDVALLEFTRDESAVDLRRRCPHAMLISTDPECEEEADFVVDIRKHEHVIPQLLRHAANFWRKNHKVYELVRDVAMRRQRMHQLNEISLALTGQMTQQELLLTILTEARRIAACEAGLLYLVERAGDDVSLVFKLAQNDTVDFPVVETRLPLSSGSIAGYVATTGKELNIQDVYRLPPDAPYEFNRTFDENNGYRSQSVLALPMRDHRGQVVGVLQFLNRVNRKDGVVVPFGEETAEVLRAIASQAAVSLQKHALLEDINQLFESFVQASVKTIEQRDPSTSGHSFRVAETTVELLQALPRSESPSFKNLQLTPEHIREVRYAALLHDFGKIGVPEAVLVKANKLSDERLEIIRYRIELQKERLRHRAVEQELDLLHHAKIDVDLARRRVHRELNKQLKVLDQYYDWVVEANRPHVLDAGSYDHLEEIRAYSFKELNETVSGVITDQDVLALSVRRGSLTPDERRQIQSHVVYTTEFLSALPWPPELAAVPDIAGAHHEVMNGTGYPHGLVGEQIPLASRVMAVCDVYDALTAMDRPYKPAMSIDAAFAILQEEAKLGLLDKELVDIFLQSGSYKVALAG